MLGGIDSVSALAGASVVCRLETTSTPPMLHRWKYHKYLTKFDRKSPSSRAHPEEAGITLSTGSDRIKDVLDRKQRAEVVHAVVTGA